MGDNTADMVRVIQIMILLFCSAVVHTQQVPVTETASSPAEQYESPAADPKATEYAAQTNIMSPEEKPTVETYEAADVVRPLRPSKSIMSDPDADAKEELELMDTDKDGKVSLEEIKAYFKKEFYSDELVEGVEAGPVATTTPTEDLQKLVDDDAQEFLDDLDTDKDGHLSLEELAEQYKFDPTASEYQDASSEEDDDQEEEGYLQEDEEDEFFQESDDEYSGDEYVDSDDEQDGEGNSEFADAQGSIDGEKEPISTVSAPEVSAY